MKKVFGLVMDVMSGNKVIKRVVKRIEEGEVFVHPIRLEKDVGYVFEVRIVEGACLGASSKEMHVWSAPRFDDEERRKSLWAVALQEGDHEVRVGVKWANHKPLSSGIDMELVFAGSFKEKMTRGRQKRAGWHTAIDHRKSGRTLERRNAGQ